MKLEETVQEKSPEQQTSVASMKINLCGFPLPENLKIFALFAIFHLFPTAYSQEKASYDNSEISHSFYITANTGQETDNAASPILREIAKASQDDSAASLLLLGNNTPEAGFLPEGEGRQQSRQFLEENILSPLRDFNGKIIFTPGVYEWNKEAPQSIDDLESFLQQDDRSDFWPDDGCPLEREDIDDNVVLITVDSQWFLEDWDEHPKINNECDLKTREQFLTEFKDDIKDSFGKTVIVAVHHPMMTNTRLGFLNRITAFSRQDFENVRQSKFRGRLETIASLFDDVIFVSGNDRNLQYLDNERNPQIISGAAAATEAVKNVDEEHFASDENGYAKLSVLKDGRSLIQFYAVTSAGSELLFENIIERERPAPDEVEIKPIEDLGPTTTSSIYKPEETQKGNIYRWIWGEHYRSVYSREVEAPVLNIDTLPGNLRPIKEGGGQQSRSVRFIDENAHEYTLRALRKSPLQYVQADVVRGSYIGDFLDDTAIERLISDFYTTAHPYAPFSINRLLDSLEIYHIDPEIFYVPKQEALGVHNEDFGDELFMMEPHVGAENRTFDEFGNADDIISTMDLLLEIRETKSAYVHEESFIKARLFDMLVGDWDRHEDQWRWAEFEQENGDRVYYPIPRDRDQAFSVYDGTIISLIKLAVPLLRKMQSYDRELDDIKWFNWSGYPLDQSFINTATWEDWEEQVTDLQTNLSDEMIDEAFATLPEEVQDESIENIKETLRYRRDDLLSIARKYYDYLQDFRMITGTEEDDEFLITRKEDGETEISITSDGREVFRNSYTSEQTDDIWIYGLDGEDRFRLEGKGSDLINLKVIGGLENDIYDFENTRRAKVYDYKSLENTIVNPETTKWLVDSYSINNYDYQKKKYSENQVLPVVDFVPDAGFVLGVQDIVTSYGLAQNPFTAQHTFGARYYFATNGFDINYSGEFAHVFHNWNFGIEGRYTSPNYFINYFGMGNNTTYNRSEVERNFNRVKIQQWAARPSLIWRNETGSTFNIGPLIHSMKVAYEEDDYIGQVFSPENDVFDQQYYAGAEFNFNHYNKNNPSYPSLGMEFDVTSGYMQNIDEHNNRFGYIEPSFSFDYPLVSSGIAVFATKVGGEVIFGDNYEFYHAATIGGNNSLRGYRNHRFNGQSSFYHSTDVRSAFALWRTKFIPIILGISAGFDYGRVWSDHDVSDRWHSNYGGALWVNALYAISGSVGLYRGEDGNRLTFTLNFKY